MPCTAPVAAANSRSAVDLIEKATAGQRPEPALSTTLRGFEDADLERLAKAKII